MVAFQNRDQHSARKRMLSNIYSKSYILKSPVLAAQAHTLLYETMQKILHEHATTGKTLNLYYIISAASMDVSSAFVFGLRNSSNLLSNPREMIRRIDEHQSRIPTNFFVQEYPWLWNWLQWAGIPIWPRDVVRQKNSFEAWAFDMGTKAERQVLEDQRSVVETGRPVERPVVDTPVVYNQLRSSLVSSWRAGAEQGGKEKEKDAGWHTLTDEQRLAMAGELTDHLSTFFPLFFLHLLSPHATNHQQPRSKPKKKKKTDQKPPNQTVAGFETTAAALTFLFYELATNPTLQSQLRNAINSVPRSPTHPTMPDPTALESLPLLHAVVLETLRLYPPVAGAQARVTPSPTVNNTTVTTLAGHSVPLPPGIRISARCYTLHRNPVVFPSPESFNPHRWLDPQTGEIRRTDAQAKKMHAWFWAFGSGGRMCLGSHLAMRDMKAVVAALVGRGWGVGLVGDGTGDRGGVRAWDQYVGGPVERVLDVGVWRVGDGEGNEDNESSAPTLGKTE